MISIKHLYKSYCDKKIFTDFSLDIPLSKITSIMGKSGCGKTTLINILMGLDKYYSGQITSVPSLKSSLFQEDRLIMDLSPVKNISICFENPPPDDEIIHHLAKVGITDKYHHPSKELSGGMARRTALVRAMIVPSDIVFLDEVFKGVDENTISLMVDYILIHKKDRTIINVIHSTDLANTMSDYVVNLEDCTDYACKIIKNNLYH